MERSTHKDLTNHGFINMELRWLRGLSVILTFVNEAQLTDYYCNNPQRYNPKWWSVCKHLKLRKQTSWPNSFLYELKFDTDRYFWKRIKGRQRFLFQEHSYNIGISDRVDCNDVSVKGTENSLLSYFDRNFSEWIGAFSVSLAWNHCIKQFNWCCFSHLLSWDVSQWPLMEELDWLRYVLWWNKELS